MTEFIYTEKTDPVKSGSRSSEVIECLYYNEKTKELLVGVVDSNNAYVYSGVPRHVYTGFANAVSKGYFWNKVVKRQYGPADDAGWTDEVNFIEYGKENLNAGPTVGTPKGLADKTSSSVLVFPLKAEAAPLPVPVDANEVVFDDAVSSTVVFSMGGETKTVDFNDKTSVRDAVAEITRIAEILGLGKSLTIKKVTINFE